MRRTRSLRALRAWIPEALGWVAGFAHRLVVAMFDEQGVLAGLGDVGGEGSAVASDAFAAVAERTTKVARCAARTGIADDAGAGVTSRVVVA